MRKSKLHLTLAGAFTLLWLLAGGVSSTLIGGCESEGTTRIIERDDNDRDDRQLRRSIRREDRRD